LCITCEMFRNLRFTIFRLGAVHKRRPHKIVKYWPLSLVLKMSALAQPPPHLSVRTHHKFWKIQSFFAPKSVDVYIWKTSPFSVCFVNVFCEQPLMQMLQNFISQFTWLKQKWRSDWLDKSRSSKKATLICFDHVNRLYICSICHKNKEIFAHITHILKLASSSTSYRIKNFDFQVFTRPGTWLLT